MTLQERFNLIPECLRDADGGATRTLDGCLLGSISYYIELLLILVAIAAFFYIIYAGIQMATAFGNESKYTAAKNTLLHAIIGIIIATLAYTIVSFVTAFFGVDAPKVYDSTTGQADKNNPALVKANVTAKAMQSLPGSGELSPEEVDHILNTEFALGDSLTLVGTNQAVYFISDNPFTAGLVTASDKPIALSEGRLPDGRYWVRGWATAGDLDGAKLTIKQYDKATNFTHTKELFVTAS